MICTLPMMFLSLDKCLNLVYAQPNLGKSQYKYIVDATKMASIVGTKYEWYVSHYFCYLPINIQYDDHTTGYSCPYALY